jgi:putrescine aminotransferase
LVRLLDSRRQIMTNSINLQENNARFVWHPMAHPKAMQAEKPAIIARGEDCWVWDADGHKLLDGVAGLWSANLGHSNKRVRDAIVAQLDELPYYNIFRGTTHPRAIELSTRLVDIMSPDKVSAALFSSGGSDAVETSLKIARQYWKVRGQADRTKFISLRQGYHGVHFGGMSVNGSANFRRPYEPMLPGCIQIETPWLYRNPFTDDPVKLGEICAEILDREITAQGPDTVAAFIAEPIQGAGGVIVPPENYWPRVREICDKHGVLLIADEVVTGFGRAGELFGTRVWKVNADLWCLAKGVSSGYVPLGVTAISSKVADAFLADTTGIGTVTHGYTYSCHPVAAAAALATLDEIERLGVVQNAARTGAHLKERLTQLMSRSKIIGDVRGKGLMVGLEMVTDKRTRATLPRGNDLLPRIAKAAYQRGAMIRTSGPYIILSPPLIITMEQIDLLVDILEASFAEVEASL